VNVLVVCFANTCRSPVVEAFLARGFGPDTPIAVRSQGLAGGSGATPEALATALTAKGLALASAPGERLTREATHDADLVLFLERALLREVVVADPSIWPKSFTLREFARRGWLNPPAPDVESFEEWRALLHAQRQRTDLLGSDASDDVSDPGLQGSVEAFEAMIDAIAPDCRKVVALLSAWTR